MKKINLRDGTPIYCLNSIEANVLDDHIQSYLNYDIGIKDGDTIVDIGANIGVFGIRLSQLFQNINIYAFEPIPEIYDVLHINAQKSLNKNFKTYMLGISDKKKEIQFTYFPNSPALSTSKPQIWEQNKKNFHAAVEGSIVNAPKKFWWTQFIPKIFIPLIAKYLTYKKKIISNKVLSLQDFIDENNILEIHLLKIDCEGEELNVLRGIGENQWKIINCIIMEVHNIDNNIKIAKSLLVNNGFKNIMITKEKGLEKANLVNIFASK